MHRSTIAAVLALSLAACNPPADRQAATPAARATPTPPAATDARCAHAASLARSLFARKAAGDTEAQALAGLSADGDYSSGWIVDAVYAPDAREAFVLADIRARCDAGTPY